MRGLLQLSYSVSESLLGSETHLAWLFPLKQKLSIKFEIDFEYQLNFKALANYRW